jgi:hypothetical protein
MKQLFPFLVLLLVGAGCVTATPVEVEDSSEESMEESAQEEEQEILDLDDVEELTVAEEDLKVNKNFELSKHTTYFATSQDGDVWTLREEPMARYASVPDLVVTSNQLGPFPEGTLLTYFVDGTQDHDAEDLGLGLVYSIDGGETWSDRLYTTMEGAPKNSVVVDPSLVVLSDGTLRLYYYDFPAGPLELRAGEPSTQTNEFHTAISSDGIHFFYEGVAYSTSDTVTDPDVIELNDAWYMYFMSHSEGSMVVSVSSDPQRFTTTQTVNERGIPGAVVVDDEVWLFSCGQDAVTRLVSEDGVTFTMVDEAVVRVSSGIHCDPSVTRLSDGSYGLVFKHIRAQDMKQVQTPTTPPSR